MSELDLNWYASQLRALPGYPWLDPCPRCGYRGSCDCTVLERARAALPGLHLAVRRALEAEERGTKE